MVRISSWKFVRVPKASTKFQLEILTTSTISVIHTFRENILESSRNVSETTPRQKTHQELIHTATPEKSHIKNNKLPLILSFNPGIMKIIKKHWHLLHCSEKCKELFPEPPLLAHRRAPNLSNILVRATLPIMNPKPRLTPHTCDSDNLPRLWNHQVQNRNRIKSRTEIANRKGKTFKLAPNTCCQTENVIYALFCKVCHKIYVGETKWPLITRWKEHRADIWHNHDTPVTRHINDNCKITNGQDIQACILSKIRGNPSKTVALRKMVDTHLTDLPTLKYEFDGIPPVHIMMPSHHLNRFWLIVNWMFFGTKVWIMTKNTKISLQGNVSKIN